MQGERFGVWAFRRMGVSAWWRIGVRAVWGRNFAGRCDQMGPTYKSYQSHRSYSIAGPSALHYADAPLRRHADTSALFLKP